MECGSQREGWWVGVLVRGVLWLSMAPRLGGEHRDPAALPRCCAAASIHSRRDLRIRRWMAKLLARLHRASMGHDLHFLQRLERISLPQVELAMSLYQDPQLVGFLLDSANLPQGAEKLAVSLDDPVAGPFLILARSGRFVTCLGAGMTIDAELPLITRSRLDSLLSKVADYRSRVEQAHKLAGNRRVTGLLRRIYTAGDELSREEFVALSAWAPLMPREFLSEMLAATEYLEKARRVLIPNTDAEAVGQGAGRLAAQLLGYVLGARPLGAADRSGRSPSARRHR